MEPVEKAALLRDLEQGREALERTAAALAGQNRHGDAARARRARREVAAVMRVVLAADPVRGTAAPADDEWAQAVARCPHNIGAS